MIRQLPLAGFKNQSAVLCEAPAEAEPGRPVYQTTQLSAYHESTPNLFQPVGST